MVVKILTTRQPVTITEGPSGYQYTAATHISGVSVTEVMSCAIDGTTSASCAMTTTIQYGKSNTALAQSVMFPQNEVPMFVPAVIVTIVPGHVLI